MEGVVFIYSLSTTMEDACFLSLHNATKISSVCRLNQDAVAGFRNGSSKVESGDISACDFINNFNNFTFKRP